MFILKDKPGKFEAKNNDFSLHSKLSSLSSTNCLIFPLCQPKYSFAPEVQALVEGKSSLC